MQPAASSLAGAGGAAANAAAAPPPPAWRRLGTPPSQLTLDFTLPTGQSFRWRRTGPGDYAGIAAGRVIALRQEPADVLWRVLARAPGLPEDEGADAAALADYFNLGVDLEALYGQWAAADARFAKVAPHFPGARMLRQDPVECLFQFICSQNNHISRIQGMVDRLCAAYGTPLPTAGAPPGAAGADIAPGDAPAAPARGRPAGGGAGARRKRRSLEAAEDTRPAQDVFAAGAGGRGSDVDEEEGASRRGASPEPSTPAGRRGASSAVAPPPPRRPRKQRATAPEPAAAGAAVVAPAATAASPAPGYFAFPSLEQLCAATEDELRALGFGYRAKYITAAAAALRAKPGGGEAWLASLRGAGAAAAGAALEGLPGVGPKVAACVALFSLDCHDAIPVDTHVWQLATRYYAPRLAGKSLTKKLHAEVAAAFVDRFGPRAGWAHGVLFVSDLRQSKGHLEAAEEAAAAAEAAPAEAAGVPAAAAAAAGEVEAAAAVAGAVGSPGEAAAVQVATG